MSLAKSILHGKEHRKPLRGAARYSVQHQPHGRCDYCLGNRMYAINKAKAKADYIEEEDDEG